MKKSVLKEAFIASLPVFAGYMVLGMGFGILLANQGYGVLWALAMSVFIFAGAMQYVAVTLVAAKTSLPVVALLTLLVNARHIFYGISLIDKYKGAGKFKPYLIFGLTDETYSLVTADNGKIAKEDKYKYYFSVTLMNQCYWVLGSVIGSLLYNVIPFGTEGIDFTLTALFITIVVDQWCKTKHHTPTLIGIGATLVCLVVCTLIGQAEYFLIASMVLITVLLFAVKKKEEIHYE